VSISGQAVSVPGPERYVHKGFFPQHAGINRKPDMKPIVEINETNFETEVPKPNQPAKVCLRLFILGATGRTGRTLAAQAGERGHQTTAFVRSPQKLGELRERVNVRQGDPRSVAELREALAGHDAVVSALGPPGLGSGRQSSAMGHAAPSRPCRPKACGDFSGLDGRALSGRGNPGRTAAQDRAAKRGGGRR
jgi:hypothetical protein